MALRRSAVRSRLAPPKRQNPRPETVRGFFVSGFRRIRSGFVTQAASAKQKVAGKSVLLLNREYNGIWLSGFQKPARAEDLGNDKNNNGPVRPVETPDDGRATVLVIEDDLILRELMVPALEDAGFAVLVAENGKIGLRIALERKIDIVVTDIFMPETDGIETIRKLRSFAPTMPILAISGQKRHRMSDTLAMSRRLGATETISKPFLPSALVASVRKLARAANLLPP